MKSEDKSRALQMQQQAEDKFNQKHLKKKEKPQKKRVFFHFFETYFSKFWGLCFLNVVYAISFVPILFSLAALDLILYTTSFQEFRQLMPLFGLIIAVVGALLTGPITAAMTYMMRNYHRGDKNTALFADFFRQFRSNYKQAVFFGLLDSVAFSALCLILPLVINLLRGDALSTLQTIVLCLGALVSFIYFSMRPYIYLMTVTVNLKVPQILRNALFFAFLGVKNNLLILVVYALSLLPTYLGVRYFFLTETLSMNSMWMLLGLAAIWLFFGFAFVWFASVTCAYAPFDRYLLQPDPAAQDAETPAPDGEYAPDELDEPADEDPVDADADAQKNPPAEGAGDSEK